MNRLVARIYDRFMLPTEEACLQAWRQEILAAARGRVLEVGAGTGANLGFYGQEVEELWLMEPDPFMREQLEQKLKKHEEERIEVTAHGVEELAALGERFDTVVVTLVLCSVPDLQGALKAIFESLRPGGQLLFLEHVASDRPVRRGVQRLVEPVWKRCAGNCHLTRETESAIEAAGFEIETIERESMRKAMPFIRPAIRGVASRPSD